jgi:hypothetical protein
MPIPLSNIAVRSGDLSDTRHSFTPSRISYSLFVRHDHLGFTPAFTAIFKPEVLTPSFRLKYFAGMPILNHELSPLRITSVDD